LLFSGSTFHPNNLILFFSIKSTTAFFCILLCYIPSRRTLQKILQRGEMKSLSQLFLHIVQKSENKNNFRFNANSFPDELLKLVNDLDMKTVMYELLIVVAFLIICRIAYIKIIRRRIDKRRWNRWQQLHTRCFETGASFLVKVERIRQQARTGTKAYVRDIDTGYRFAIWYPQNWPAAGSIMLIQGNFWGGEHHNEEVFYVNTYMPHGWLPERVYNGWRRHNKRLAALNKN
jgi:hypothetical protein